MYSKKTFFQKSKEKMTSSQSQPPGHWDRVSLAVRTQLLSNPPDLWLVSSEGYSLPTYTSLLTLHSPLLKALLSSTSSFFSNTSSTFSLSLPVPALPLQLLISLLSQGSVSHHVPFNPLEVTHKNSIDHEYFSTCDDVSIYRCLKLLSCLG